MTDTSIKAGKDITSNADDDGNDNEPVIRSYQFLYTLTNTSSARVVGVLMAPVTSPSTNSWLACALAGCLITYSTISVQCVGFNTVTV